MSTHQGRPRLNDCEETTKLHRQPTINRQQATPFPTRSKRNTPLLFFNLVHAFSTTTPTTTTKEQRRTAYYVPPAVSQSTGQANQPNNLSLTELLRSYGQASTNLSEPASIGERHMTRGFNPTTPNDLSLTDLLRSDRQTSINLSEPASIGDRHMTRGLSSSYT